MKNSAFPSFSRHWVAEALVVAVLVAALAGVCQLVLASSVYRADWEVLARYRDPLIRGWWTTIWISLVALALSTGFAALLVWGQKTGLLSLRRACQAVIELIRGTPLFVQLLIAFYVVAVAVEVQSRYLVGVAALAVFSAAYLAEIFRAGIDSVEESQREAARAAGFTPWQSFWMVILPQAVRRILPGVAGEFANLIKNSSLLSILAVPEFTKEVRDANANSYAILELYLPLALGYLLLTVPIGVTARWLEGRYHFAS